MAQAETEKLTRMLFSAALSRAVCTIAELGIADQIDSGSPQAVESLAAATGIHEQSLYRIAVALSNITFPGQPWDIPGKRQPSVRPYATFTLSQE